MTQGHRFGFSVKTNTKHSHPNDNLWVLDRGKSQRKRMESTHHTQLYVKFSLSPSFHSRSPSAQIWLLRMPFKQPGKASGVIQSRAKQPSTATAAFNKTSVALSEKHDAFMGKHGSGKQNRKHFPSSTVYRVNTYLTHRLLC